MTNSNNPWANVAVMIHDEAEIRMDSVTRRGVDGDMVGRVIGRVDGDDYERGRASLRGSRADGTEEHDRLRREANQKRLDSEMRTILGTGELTPREAMIRANRGYGASR